MKQILYAMQFRGQASPGSAAGVMTAQTEAQSCRMTSTADERGLSSLVEPIGEAAAMFRSEVTMCGDSKFVESGSITFGGDHCLRFSTVGEGYIGPCAEPGLKHGAVIWRVEGGGGQFDRASGLITSNFTIDDAGGVIDNHYGVIFLE